MQLESSTLVAGITFLGSAVTAALSYYFTRRQQREAQWRENKLNHYKVLLAAMSDLAIDNGNQDAHQRFAIAVNTIALVAPQDVVEAMLAYHEGIQESNPNRSRESHDKLLANLVLAIRRDLGVRPKDDSSRFQYHLVGTPRAKGLSNDRGLLPSSGAAVEQGVGPDGRSPAAPARRSTP